MNTKNSASPPTPRGRPLTTEEFAQFLSMKAQSIRKRYAQTGTYHGVRPQKAANGRLYWQPEDARKIMKEA